MKNNTQQIINTLKKEKFGLSITDLVKKTTLSRSEIRTALSFLLGSNKIIERRVGMAKLYLINNVRRSKK